MANLFQLMGTIGINSQSFESGMQRIESALNDVASKMEKVGQKAEQLGQQIGAIGDRATQMGAGITAGVTAPVVGGLLGIVAASEEVTQAFARIEASSAAAGRSAEESVGFMSAMYGLTGDIGRATEITQAANLFAGSKESLSELEKIVAGVDSLYGDMAPAESFMESLNETIKTGKLTGALTDVLNWYDGESFNEEAFQKKLDSLTVNSSVEKFVETLGEDNEKLKKKVEGMDNEDLGKYIQDIKKEGTVNQDILIELERAHAQDALLVSKVGKATNSSAIEKMLMGELGSRFSSSGENFMKELGPLAEQREAQLKLMKSLSDASQAVLPLLTELTEKITGLVDKFNALSPKQQEIVIKLLALAAVIGPLVTLFGFFMTGVGGLIATFGKLATMAPAVTTAVTGTGSVIMRVGTFAGTAAVSLGRFAKNFGLLVGSKGLAGLKNLGKLVTTFRNAAVVVNVVTKAVRIFGLLFTPTGWIVLGIGAVVGIIALLVKNFDKVKEVAGNVKDKLVEMATTVKDYFASKFEEVKEAILNPLDYVKNQIGTRVEQLKKLFGFEWELPKFDLEKIPGVKKIKDFAKGLMNTIDKIFNGDEEKTSMSTPNYTQVGGASKVDGSIYNAKGAFMSRATVLGALGSKNVVAGEAGNEALLPLEGKHMFPMADAIASRLSGSGQPQIVNHFTVNATIREEADVDKLAVKLEAKQRRKNNSLGVT